MGGEWRELQRAAAAIDRRLKGGQPDGSTSAQFRTLVHGDTKAENILFSQGRSPLQASSCLRLAPGPPLPARAASLLLLHLPRPSICGACRSFCTSACKGTSIKPAVPGCMQVAMYDLQVRHVGRQRGRCTPVLCAPWRQHAPIP